MRNALTLISLDVVLPFEIGDSSALSQETVATLKTDKELRTAGNGKQVSEDQAQGSRVV